MLSVIGISTSILWNEWQHDFSALRSLCDSKDYLYTNIHTYLWFMAVFAVSDRIQLECQ